MNSIICLDFETGGLDPSKNPATELAYQAFDLDSYKPVLEFSSYIIPYDELVLDPKAMEFTGISIQQLMNGLDTKELMKKIQEDFSKANSSGNFRSKPILLGHNVGFDVGFLLYLFKKHRVDIEKYLDCNFGIPKVIDTLVLAKQKWANDPKVAKYNLTACMSAAGIEYYDAHNAMNDVRATKELFFYFTNNLRTGTSSSEETKSIRYRNHFKF